MPSIINASSSGSGGLVQTADASGVLQLQSNGTLAVSISGATTTLSGNMVVNNQVSSSGDLNLDAVFSVMIKKSGSTNATINQFGIGLAGSNLSSGIGLAFPASQSASSDPNTLDDYEEGSWTPSYALGSGSATFSTVTAVYRKIGSVVNLSLRFNVSSASSAANLAISGLPFPFLNGIADSSGIMREYALTGAFWGLSFGSATTVSMQRYDNSNSLPNGAPGFSCSFTYITS
jgi:hypothetical protein